jgi:hypothetical protein
MCHQAKSTKAMLDKSDQERSHHGGHFLNAAGLQHREVAGCLMRAVANMNCRSNFSLPIFCASLSARFRSYNA